MTEKTDYLRTDSIMVDEWRRWTQMTWWHRLRWFCTGRIPEWEELGVRASHDEWLHRGDGQ